jgi:putative oxidoreductase
LKVFATVAAPPTLRIALALPFFRSGLTRWDGFFSLSQGTIFLFKEQFKLHIFGDLYSFPAPLACAYLVGISEITLPVLLVFGLATRFSAVGLLIMTGVIQLTYPEGWVNFHLYWAALALATMALGPAPLSLDWLIGRISPPGDNLWQSGLISRSSTAHTILKRERMTDAPVLNEGSSRQQA